MIQSVLCVNPINCKKNIVKTLDIIENTLKNEDVALKTEQVSGREIYGKR